MVYISLVTSDTPANCTFKETRGQWKFMIGSLNSTNKIDCTNSFPVAHSIKLNLLFPNVATDQYGNIGTWTMIYNQGFEVVLLGRRYFAFQQFASGDIKSNCSRTNNGWVHDNLHGDVFPPKNWGCFKGEKFGHKHKNMRKEKLSSPVISSNDASAKLYQPDLKYIQKINEAQNLWQAEVYEEYKDMTIKDMLQRAGSTKISGNRVYPNENLSKYAQEEADMLPKSIDWRNIDGVNYISPIRNQGTCGSCYAFASMALLEANVRIESKNKLQPVFSTQDVVSCSEYSQGCDGGFPYLVAGKYAQDFGVIEEKDYPYVGNTTKCQRPNNVTKTYVSNYGYIGGFYGGCHETLMRIHLATKGPLAVSIMVYSDLQFYKSGIYIHTGLGYDPRDFNPWEVTNHVVLVVGYGEEAGVKYWVVKNSWGENWGEDGYFRIRRGTDEIAIESMAVYAEPYVNL